MNATQTILYVEDSSYNLLLVKAILAPHNQYQLLTASTGSQGLLIAQQQQVDLVLLDLNLPDMRGEEFLRRLRSLPSFVLMPIIVVSGEVITERVDLLTKLGVVEVLVKLFDIDHFEKIIDQRLAQAH